jgi:carboxymethylenebutenolidase
VRRRFETTPRPRGATDHAPTPVSDSKPVCFAPGMCHTDDSRAPGPPRKGPVGDHGELELTSSDGNRFRAFRAVPTAPVGGMVILPDVRGLHPYYEDLTMRFAEAGFTTVAIDYFGRSAGIGKRDDSFDWKSHFQKVTPEGVAHDVGAAVAKLRADAKDPEIPIFTVGFCFGGANSWRQSGEGHDLAGCIGFYGGKPMDRAGAAIPKMTAPLLMLLAGDDQGTPPAEFEEFAKLVRARGLEVESHTYPGAPHSYFDRSFAEHREACQDSWKRILDFTERYSRPK